jgi:hypothetical protein
LFSYIAHKPEKYFETCNGYQELLEPIELAENHFDGQIYTLIDGGGFSTAGHIVALIKYHKIGKIIGSEHGCTFTCNDNSTQIYLKNTGHLANIARSTFAVAVDGMRADQGVMPDLPVAFSVANFINGVDTEMEFALGLIQPPVSNGPK